MTTTKPKDPSGPADSPAENDQPWRRTLLDRLRENLQEAERMNLDFMDLSRALPSSGVPISLREVARRLGVDLTQSAQRDVLLFGLFRHCKILRLRNEDDGRWMFARRPRRLSPVREPVPAATPVLPAKPQGD